MTRVLHLITRWVGGGAETTTRNALAALSSADRAYDLRLGTGAAHDPERLADLRELGVETTAFRSIRHYNPFAALIAVVAVAWHLRRTDVEILHTHSTEAGVIGRLAAAFAGTPTVVHEVHGDPMTADRNGLLNRFLLAAERRCARLSDRIVVKSERIRETYLDRGIGRPEQYVVIHHGVETERFRTAAPERREREAEPVRLLFVGRLADGKGLFDLLDALERVAESRDVWLQIAGEGPLAEELAREIDERGLPAELLGYREDVPALMADADVLALPSYREGTPRVVTEAMASGLPVVATAIAGIPDQVADGESGYLVEPGDVAALADRIADLVEDPETRAAFGSRGQERAEEFDIDRAKDAYRELYRSL
ncbi:MAG: glycosyltransferase family 4 protein [Halorientalis sp.]